MRLWHYSLIPYLPDSQLIAQWRELNSIFKNQPRHILINYVYNYDKSYLKSYSWAVIDEMKKRNFKIKSFDNMIDYFGEDAFIGEIVFYPEHNDRYLLQCFFNLQEKHDRYQEDFTMERYLKMYDFVVEEVRDVKKHLFLSHR